MRLLYVVLHTGDLARLKRFYRDQFLIGARFDSPHWVELDTAGCTLALHPGPADASAPSGRAGVEEVSISLQVDDLDAMVAACQARGVEFIGEIEMQPAGKYTRFRDPQGNLVALHEPRQVPAEDLGPKITTVILNCQDIAEMQSFYSDRVGLGLRVESPHWVEFDLSGTGLALHPWSARGQERFEHGVRPIVFGFHANDVRTWVADLRGRRVKVVTEPTDQGWGTHAEVADPDGNIIILREPRTGAADAHPDAAAAPAGATPGAPWRTAKVKARRAPRQPAKKSTGPARRAGRKK